MDSPSNGDPLGRLAPRDLNDLRRSGLSDETIRSCGIYTGTAEEVRTILLGRDVGPGMVIPYPPAGGQSAYCRIKPHRPPVYQGKPAKYLAPKGSGNRLYVPQALEGSVLQDRSAGLLITEGEKKALKAVQEGYLCIGLAGVWNFREKTEGGGHRVLPELQAIQWHNRDVWIVYDSDAATNDSVLKAEHMLAQTLMRKRANVRVVRLPGGPGDDKVGLDDFLVSERAPQFRDLLREARPPAMPEKRERGPQESPAETIVKLTGQAAQLFHDQTNRAFARFEVNGHHEIQPCSSRIFRRWLSSVYYDCVGKVAGGESVNAALSVIEARACFDEPEYRLENRTAWQDAALWYDLGDERWRAVRVSTGGWAVEAMPPILFRRHEHQAAQVEPVAGGDIDRLFDFVSVRDDDARLLLKVWLVASFVPGFPHPVVLLHGPQGSGKSSVFRVVRSLVDPSIIGSLSLPGDQTELVQMLSHHWCCLFDNVDLLQAWQSDALCRAVTGEGFSKRQLYTDDEDIIYHFQRCVGLNGINVAATRADLLDRSILIGLDRIPPELRKEESRLEAALAEARPQVLGGIFDALSLAMALKPGIRLESHPRMADFAAWGCAISQALGTSAEAFLTALQRNQQSRNEEVLVTHPVAVALDALMALRARWEGRPTELLSVLDEIAQEQKIDTKSRSWPKQPNVLTRRINEIKPNLAEAGIFVEQANTRERRYTLRRDDPSAADAVPRRTAHEPCTDNPMEDNGMGGTRGLRGDSPTLLDVLEYEEGVI